MKKAKTRTQFEKRNIRLPKTTNNHILALINLGVHKI